MCVCILVCVYIRVRMCTYRGACYLYMHVFFDAHVTSQETGWVRQLGPGGRTSWTLYSQEHLLSVTQLPVTLEKSFSFAISKAKKKSVGDVQYAMQYGTPANTQAWGWEHARRVSQGGPKLVPSPCTHQAVQKGGDWQT